MRSVSESRCRSAAALLSSIALPGALAMQEAPPAATESAAAVERAEAEGREWFGAPDALPWWQWSRATGDWGGARTSLEDAGIEIGGEYIAEYTSVWSGGLNERASFRHLFTLDAALDFETMFAIEGGTLFAQFLAVNAEKGGSRDAGDIQVYSNLESLEHLNVLYELWYEQVLVDERLRIKVGKVDANSEFAFVDVAGEFANSSAGFQPTIFVFPSYPDPAMSVNVFGRVLETDGLDLTLGYGFYDGALGADGVPTGRRGPSTFFSDDLSDDYFHIGQAELTWDALVDDGGSWLSSGRFSIGGWLHTGEFERFDGGTEKDTAGFFLTLEQRVLNRADGSDGGGLYVFGQYGWADDAISEFGQHIAAGVVTRGTIPSRDQDSAGVYCTLADLSDEPAAGFEEDEFVVDAYYRVQVTPFAYIQPEIQFIVDPSGDPTVDDAVVGGVRVGIAF